MKLLAFLKQWDKLREEFLKDSKLMGHAGQTQEEDPVIAEAIKLFGADLIEIKELIKEVMLICEERHGQYARYDETNAKNAKGNGKKRRKS